MSLEYYLGLLDYEPRIRAFQRAIQAVVGPGDRVLEIGAGIGTFSFFAARAGAGRVWAVEPEPIIHLAEAVARANGLHDRIEFVRGNFPDAVLPDEFDVLVFEDFKQSVLDEDLFRLLRPFEGEFLERGGRMIPSHVRLSVSPAYTGMTAPLGRRSASASPDRSPGGSKEGTYDLFGIDWSPVAPYVANHPRRAFLDPEILCGVPKEADLLPLLPLPRADDLGLKADWTFDRDTRIDSLVVWFDLQTAPGIWISNAPGPAAGPWGQMLLPLAPTLEVAAGCEISAEVTRNALLDGAPGWLSWRAETDGSRAEGHEFAGFPASLGDLTGNEDR